MTREQIERKYGVKIQDDSFYSWRKGKNVKQYKMYTADGCLWENGLKTIKAVEQECMEWADALMTIKNIRRAMR